MLSSLAGTEDEGEQQILTHLTLSGGPVIYENNLEVCMTNLV